MGIADSSYPIIHVMNLYLFPAFDFIRNELQWTFELNRPIHRDCPRHDVPRIDERIQNIRQ